MIASTSNWIGRIIADVFEADTGRNGVSETLKAIIAEATGLSSDAINISPRPPLHIQSNRLYDAWAGDRHLIVKEFLKPAEFHDAPVREFRALKLLAPLDIAPQPVLFRPLAGPPLGPLVVYEFMEGQMWGRYRPTDAELAQLAEVWVKMNAVPTEDLWMSRGYERSLDETAARLLGLLQAYAAWAEAEFPPGLRAVELCFTLLESRRAVTRELTTCDPPLCFCRADPRFANVIRRPDGRLGLVDWEDSGLRDPARDLADIMTHPNQEDLMPPDGWQAFLQPYLAVRGGSDPGLSRRVHLYLALFPVFWLAVLLSEGVRRSGAGEQAGWRVHGLSPNEKLRRYLARSLAWPETDFSGQMEMLTEVAFFPEG